MENKDVNTKINIMLQKVKEYSSEETDSRFMKCKIWVMHTSGNYNGSYFSKDVVEKAMPTLKNTPILAYIEPNKENELDVSDHRTELEKDENGNYKFSYKGQAIGVIPESNNAHFETRLCDDGIEREYLVTDALIWTKWDVVNEIFEKQPIKNQSMELSEEYSGSFANDGLFHFSDFKFNGCCAISVEPAMKNSTIEVQFSATDVAKEIENKLNEFAKYFSKPKEVEETDMAKKKVKEEVLDNEKPNDEKAEEVVETNNEKVDEPKETEEEVKTENAKSEENDEMDDNKMDDDNCEDTEDKKNCECSDKKKYSLNFSLSYEDIRNQLYEKLWDMESIENTCYCIVKTQDEYFVYADCCEGTFYKQNYTKSNDEVSFVGEREEIFNVMVDKATYDEIQSVTYSKLKEDLKVANKKIEEYSKTNSELLEFKSNVEEENRKAEIDKVISQFSAIDGLDLESYRLKAYNKEIEKDNLEKELYSVLGRQNFSKMSNNQETNNGASFGVSLKEPSKCPYENLEDLFKP